MATVNLALRIKTWRSARGLTQRQLAERVGVTVAAVSYWESGTNPPSLDHLGKLVVALGATMKRFYGRVPKARAA